MTKRKKPRSLPAFAPSYLEKLQALGTTLQPGTVTVVTVMHDDDCPRIATPPGLCTCDADIAPVEGAS